MKQNKGFKKVLSKRDVINLGFGSMVGWGWVVLTGTWIQNAGSIGSILAFVIGGVMVVLVGLTFAELASAMPQAGGPLVYSYRSLGARLSFICSWMLCLCYISIMSFEAIGLPTLVEYFFPNYKVGYLWTAGGYDIYATWLITGIIASIIICAINYFGTRTVAIFQGICILFITAAGIMLLTGSLFTGSISNMEPFVTRGSKGFLEVMIMTPFMFVGFDIIPQASEEMDFPQKSIGKILIFSVILAALWYILIILAVSLTMNGIDMKNSSLIVADAMSKVFGGTWAGKILVLAGIMGIISSWVGFYVGVSRLIYAMASAKMLPGWFAKLHPKYNTPSNAIIFIGVLSTLAPFFGRSMLFWVVNAGSLGVVISYFIVAISFLALRYREPEMKRPFKVTNGKIIGYLASVFSLFFIALYLPGSPSALIWPYEWGIFIIWALLGIGCYIWSRMSGCDVTIKMEQGHNN